MDFCYGTYRATQITFKLLNGYTYIRRRIRLLDGRVLLRQPSGEHRCARHQALTGFLSGMGQTVDRRRSPCKGGRREEGSRRPPSTTIPPPPPPPRNSFADRPQQFCANASPRLQDAKCSQSGWLIVCSCMERCVDMMGERCVGGVTYWYTQKLSFLYYIWLS